MRLLILFALLLLPIMAFAQIVPAPSDGPSNPVTQFRANGFGYQFDPGGRSTSLYDMGSGMIGYQSRDRSGRVTGFGTIYQGIQTKPLELQPDLQDMLTTQPYYPRRESLDR